MLIDKLKLNAVAKIGKETYAISAVNGPRRENQLILYTPSFVILPTQMEWE